MRPQYHIVPTRPIARCRANANGHGNRNPRGRAGLGHWRFRVSLYRIRTDAVPLRWRLVTESIFFLKGRIVSEEGWLCKTSGRDGARSLFFASQQGAGGGIYRCKWWRHDRAGRVFRQKPILKSKAPVCWVGLRNCRQQEDETGGKMQRSGVSGT